MTSAANTQNSIPPSNPAAASAPSYASAAGATKKPASSPLIATGSNPPPVVVGSSAPSSHHAKNSSVSPVNGRPSIPPAVPAVIHGSNLNGGAGDHSRKSSVTISANGPNSFGANGGPVGGSKAAIQFGFKDSPAVAHSTPQPNTSAPIPIPGGNPRVLSPAHSPSPIPQPSASGGRPPSGLHQPGGQVTFGSLGSDGDRHMRQHSVNNPNLPTQPGAHLRRESNHSVASTGDMSNQGVPGPGPNRSNFQHGARARGGYTPNNAGYNQHNPQLGYPPQNQFRNGHGGPGRGIQAPYQPQSRQMQQFPNSPQPNRSPALVASLPNTPNMAPATMQPNMPVANPAYHHYAPPMGAQPGMQNYGFPPQQPAPVDTYGRPLSMGYPSYPQMSGFMPGSQTNPPYNPQQFSMAPPYHQPGPSNMSRTPSHSDKNSLASGPPSQPVIVSGTPQPPTNQPKAPIVSSNIFNIPKKSHAIPIKAPNTGDVLDVANIRTPSSPAPSIQHSKTPPIVRSTPTPPPKSSTPGHTRTDSHAPQKTAEEVRDELREKIMQATKAPLEDKAKNEAAHKEAAEKAAAEEKSKADAKAKAEAEEKAEREAKQKAEQEAKQKAEQEAKQKAEQKAKEDAQAAADSKAAEEAKQKLEEEAALKAEAEAKKKAEEEKAAEEAKKTKESEEDELERQIREMEEEDARREKEQEEYTRKKKAAAEEAKKVADKEKAEKAAEDDRKLREQEREMERLEEEKEKARSSRPVVSFQDELARARGSPAAGTPKEAESPKIGAITDSLANLSVGGDSKPSTPTGTGPKAGSSEKRAKPPAALNLAPLITKPVEPPQPSAALQSLKSARFLTVMKQEMYPQGIKSPNPALNPAVSKRGRSFRYPSDFLLQFQTVFTEQPSLEFQSQVKALIGDTDTRSASARTPGPGNGRQGSRSGQSFPAMPFMPGPVGANRQLPSGLTSEQRFALSQGGAVPRPQPGSMGTFPRTTGGFPGSSLMTRNPSTSNTANIPGSPRQGSRAGRGGSRKNDFSAKDAQAAKTMPLTQGQEVKPIIISSTGWKASSLSSKPGQGGLAAAGAAAPAGHLDPEIVQRKVKAALNKMTPENFDRIADQILAISSQSKNEKDGRTLRQVIQLTFEKATDEAHWASMYAKFCKRMLDTMSPEIQDDTIRDKSGNVVSGGALFRKYLLNRCQEEFERGWKASVPLPKEGEDKKKSLEAAMLSEEYYIEAAAKRRGLGLVQFIGELYKLGMLTERIMHECVRKLVDNVEEPDEQEIESLTKLLRTIGATLDGSDKGRPMMDVYFQRIRTMIDLPDLASRLKFMLMDVVDLRKKNWHSKEQNKGPKTLEEVRAEAEAAALAKAQEAARGSQRGPPGARPQLGRGDVRNFSSGQYNQPVSNQVGMDDLRRLKGGATRAASSVGTFGPASLLSSRSNSGRRGVGPGGSLARAGEESGASSRTGTPPTRESTTHSANAFSLLANMESENPASPPSTAASPSLSKVVPDQAASGNGSAKKESS